MEKISKIGLVLETDRVFGQELMRGIAKYARIHGPWLIHNELKCNQSLIRRLKAWGCNGLIIRDKKANFPLLDIGVPTIFAPTDHEPKERHANIISNDNAIGKLAAEYLMKRGFKNFGYCGYSNIYWSNHRGKSFTKKIADNGFTFSLYEINRSIVDNQWEKDQISLSQWLKSLPKPVAVFCCNDRRGLHIIEACKLASFSVPETVAVLGVDNDELQCELSGYQLSSIQLNIRNAGYKGAQLLNNLIKKKKVKNKTIIVQPTSVVTRESTDILAIENKNVAEALSYIRKHASKPLQVRDVIDAIAISRRALYEQFREVLGCSIHEEIMRCRIEEFTRLLLETDMTITQIAYALGEGDNKHISRPFRKYKGMSPGAYRKLYKNK